jgi:hypothetical protein
VTARHLVPNRTEFCYLGLSLLLLFPQGQGQDPVGWPGHISFLVPSKLESHTVYII